MIKKKILKYTVVYTPEPEGGYTVNVPKLPGCITYGKNLKEAQKMAKDAIKLYIKSLQKHKEEVPLEKDPAIVGSIDLELPTVNA